MFSPSTITTEISICFYVLGRAASRMLVQSLDDAISESARNQAAEIASQISRATSHDEPSSSHATPVAFKSLGLV